MGIAPPPSPFAPRWLRACIEHERAYRKAWLFGAIRLSRLVTLETAVGMWLPLYTAQAHSLTMNATAGKLQACRYVGPTAVTAYLDLRVFEMFCGLILPTNCYRRSCIKSATLVQSAVCYCVPVHPSQSSTVYKKLSCPREAARCFVSLNISLSHSRLFKMTPWSRACGHIPHLHLTPFS